MLPISEMRRDESGLVAGIHLDDDTTSRLLRLGLTPGRKIRLLRGGSRCLVMTAGATIALDKRIAAGVQVQVSR